MKYVTLADLARTIRRNFHKIPHDVDFVMGVPRSGVIAASIISEFLNVPLIDVDSFCYGADPTGGARLRFHKPSDRKKPRVLVVDDTMFSGRSMNAARQKLKSISGDYDFLYMVVYLEGPCNDVDIWLESLRQYTEHFTTFVLYEWNIFHHTERTMSRCLYDIDGVFCVNPPDERDNEPYLNYIRNATPLFTPTVKIGEIVTYRLSINESIVRQWLDKHGIKYGALTMFPANTWEERHESGITPSAFKADIYGRRHWAKLFVESDDVQAKEIHDRTGKPVYCVESNKMYE